MMSQILTHNAPYYMPVREVTPNPPAAPAQQRRRVKVFVRW
jgi:hypothetical protein